MSVGSLKQTACVLIIHRYQPVFKPRGNVDMIRLHYIVLRNDCRSTLRTNPITPIHITVDCSRLFFLMRLHLEPSRCWDVCVRKLVRTCHIWLYMGICMSLDPVMRVTWRPCCDARAKCTCQQCRSCDRAIVQDVMSRYLLLRSRYRWSCDSLRTKMCYAIPSIL